MAKPSPPVVPGPVLVAFWGLETDFGAGIGSLPTLTSVTTLAYDCRRSDMFRAHLFDSLRIVERGDLARLWDQASRTGRRERRHSRHRGGERGLNLLQLPEQMLF